MFWKKKSASQSNPSGEQMNYHVVAVSDTGCFRTNNEDAVRFIRPSENATRMSRGCLAIVADGMGGHASGEVASSIAIETFSKAYYLEKGRPVKALQNAADEANFKIWEKAQKNKKLKGMGTTFTAAALIGNMIYILHIGDSRAYLYKKSGDLIQLSEDHTYVQSLLNSGKISPFEAKSHPDSNILTKSLGTAEKRSCDVFLANELFKRGDKLLLCSDGLYDYFTSDELASFLRKPDLETISAELSKTVKDLGAMDNFTYLLVESRQKPESVTKSTRSIIPEL